MNQNDLVSELIKPVAKRNGWDWSSLFSYNRGRLEKDGYEIWFFNDEAGFELTIENPESSGRKTIFKEKRNTSYALYVASLIYVLEHAEQMVAQCE